MPHRNRRKSKTKNHRWRILKFAGIPIVLIVIFLAYFIFLRPKFWNGKSRLAVASWRGREVAITVYDPESNKVTQINLPENLELEAAFNLGTWRVGSLWELGEQHHLGGGRVLAFSLTKSLGLPIEGYLASGQTNLSLGDRIAVSVFKFLTKEASQVEIDLAQTSFLYKDKLADGTLGYRVKQTPPLTLTTIFADSEVIAEGLNVVLIDQSGSREKVQKVGKIIEVLGTKVIAVKTNEIQDFDCTVSPKVSNLAQKISQVFGCRPIKGESQRVEVTFGEKFRQRF